MAATIPSYVVYHRFVHAAGTAQEGQPLVGALVELKRGAIVRTLQELDNSAVYWSATAIPQGRYDVWVNGSPTGQSMAVGTGEVAAVGHQVDAMLVGTATGWKLFTVAEVRALLGIEEGDLHQSYPLAPGTSWTINHTLANPTPTVTVTDAGGNDIELEVVYDPVVTNRIRLFAGSAMSGTATLS